MHEEERPKTRIETEKPTGETRKRKRVVEEAETEQGQKEKVSVFISNSALVSWEKSLN